MVRRRPRRLAVAHNLQSQEWSKSMDHQNQLQAARTFADAFAESLGESLTQRAGTRWRFKSVDEPDAVKPFDRAVNFRLSLAGGLQGECLVAFDQAQVVSLGSKLLEQPAAAFNDEQGEALAEGIVTAMDGLSSAL